MVEPFAGGASVSLGCILSGCVERAVLAEKNSGVFSFWETLMGGKNGAFDSLCDLVTHGVEPTRAWFRDFAATVGEDAPIWRRGALAFLKSRFSFGGIVGAKGGLVSDAQIARLWLPRVPGLLARMRRIRSERHRFVLRSDAMEAVAEFARHPDALFFADPPYSYGRGAPGASLYTHHELDHDALLSALATVQGHVIATYNQSADTLALAARHGFRTEALAMRDGRGRQRQELLLTKRTA